MLPSVAPSREVLGGPARERQPRASGSVCDPSPPRLKARARRPPRPSASRVGSGPATRTRVSQLCELRESGNGDAGARRAPRGENPQRPSTKGVPMRQAPASRSNPGPSLSAAEEARLDELIGDANLNDLRCAIRDALGIRDQRPGSAEFRELMRRAVVSIDAKPCSMLRSAARLHTTAREFEEPVGPRPAVRAHHRPRPLRHFAAPLGRRP